MRSLTLSLFIFLLPIAFFSVQAQTTPSGNSDNLRGFARAVAVSDGSVFIGEPQNAHRPGVVYVYGRSGDEWSEQARIKASDGEVGDGFGASLNASGDRILVGAPEWASERGAAYIFERSNDGSWSEITRIAPSDTSGESEFGASVALNRDFAFIGAPEERDDEGAVYVFRRNDDGSWTKQARLTNPDTSKGITFGSALAVKDGQLLIGAPRKQGGAVYVYRSNDRGSWSKKATLASKAVDKNARFGSTLSLHDDQALIGAPRHADGTGAVLVYRLDGETWKADGRLLPYDGEPRNGFGSSLAFAGSNVWIGAPHADEGRGALYQYERDPKGQKWSAVKKVEGPDRKQRDRFAGSISVDGNIAAVGLVGADYGAGTAAILERDGSAGSWSVQATVQSEISPMLEPITGNRVQCSDGNAGQFGCNNVDLLSFLPINALGGDRGVQLNDIWGWTDPQTGKEYALVGRMDGTSFVDVSNPSNPVYIGSLPKTASAQASSWRDIKVYKNHVFIVSDNAGNHGMQVFDLTNLRDFEGSPLTFEETTHYDNIHSAHNIVINTETGFAYIVGSSGGGKTCGGGLHMVNIQEPTNPTFAGCFSDPSTGRSGTGYTHDAQCVIYEGPDAEYQGREICIGANETDISVADVTDKENPRAISTASYPNHGYVHQGWLTEDHRYFFQNDELDELNGTMDETRTLVWDMTDLDDPQLVREFMLGNPASDHNLYVKGNTMYQSNYVSGLQVVDITSPEDPVVTGHFDTEPFGRDEPGFAGTWSNYPFFDSGIIIMSSMQEGLFILQKQKQNL